MYCNTSPIVINLFLVRLRIGPYTARVMFSLMPPAQPGLSSNHYALYCAGLAFSFLRSLPHIGLIVYCISGSNCWRNCPYRVMSCLSTVDLTSSFSQQRQTTIQPVHNTCVLGRSNPQPHRKYRYNSATIQILHDARLAPIICQRCIPYTRSRSTPQSA